MNPSYFGDGISFAGDTGIENKYFIDGVEVTDPYIGDTSTRLPYNFIQALEFPG